MTKRLQTLEQQYEQARQLAINGQLDKATSAYGVLSQRRMRQDLRRRVTNDLAVIAAVEGRVRESAESLQLLLNGDVNWAPARENLSLLRDSIEDRLNVVAAQKVKLVAQGRSFQLARARTCRDTPFDDTSGRGRVAILSLLFNWPSTGGGVIHTIELAKFLALAGYRVRHVFARLGVWGIGQVEEPLPAAIDSWAIDFDHSEWNATAIQAAFRAAVDSFGPDAVILTDTWNFKPLLAETMHGYPVILRQQALECVCPLNNYRLVFEKDKGLLQCPGNQVAHANQCKTCLRTRSQQSGALHRVERALSGVGTDEYDRRLHKCLSDAYAVLVLNPEIAELLRPFSKDVRVVTWGMDPDRFPRELAESTRNDAPSDRKQIFMAGVIDEQLKGFDVLQAACGELWKERHDFELVVTGRQAGQLDAFTRSVGWLSQQELPRQLREAFVLVMPSVAQEALGRPTVEAMAVGLPVIASRIGGLPYTVSHEETGLLFEPGSTHELSQCLRRLLDNPEEARNLGKAGRARFEAEFTWPSVIKRHYEPLLDACVTSRVARRTSQ